MTQRSLFIIDPETGNGIPLSKTASIYRKLKPQAIWNFNPWACNRRDPRDIETDPQGLLIVPPNESLLSAS